MTPRRFLIAAICAVALLFAGTASTAATVPVDNTAVIYDTYGQRLDAHDGSLLQAPDGTIYLYGTAYGCGFTLGKAGPYCGVRVYTTTDLRTFAPAGAIGGVYAFDHLTSDWQATCTAPNFGCYRPHVVRRPSDGRYVMWLNVAGKQGYRTLVADAPGGPFVDTGITPTLAVQPPCGGLRYGDEDVTIAPDGRGYVTYTAIDPVTNAHTLVIEELDATLTTGTGRHVVISTGSDPEMVEAPSLFYSPTGAWYLIYSNPARPYATTGTGIVNGPAGPDPIGAYTSPRSLAADSCSGQPTGVWSVTGPSGAVSFVYSSDRWVTGASNQSKANNYYGTLTFTANGGTAIDAYTCQAGWTLS